jgi:DNA replication protein DnaD
MARNTKPMLTVLVEEDKLQRLRDYAASQSVSMGWLVNRLIDRLLSGELSVSEDSYSSGNVSTGLSRDEIQEMIKASIEDISTPNLDIETLVNSSTPSIGSEDIEKIARQYIETSIDTLTEMIGDTETELKDRITVLESDLTELKKPSAIG